MSYQRSNKDEFLSFLGTCMTFYNMHLTPEEQDAVIEDMLEVINQNLPEQFDAVIIDHYMEGGETDGKDGI